MRKPLLTLIAACTLSHLAYAQVPAAPPLPEPTFSDSSPWPEALFEIFRIQPGQHEAFIRSVSDYDKVSASVGLPPARLYFHDHGDEWDILILKVIGEHEITPEMTEKMAAKTKELGLPTGPAFFIESRKSFSWHKDTQATGPISADQWLARLDKWRKENPGLNPLPLQK